MGAKTEAAAVRWSDDARRLARAAAEAASRALHGESVRLRAMALTYLSLFALVPALVVAFSVVQAFTGMERISERVNEFLFENLAVGARATIEPYLKAFVQNAHVTSAGLVGGALLVWSAVSLFSNVDRALNDIWGIRRRRSLASQAVTYWVGLTLGPLLLAGSVMVGSSTRSFLASTGMREALVGRGFANLGLGLAAREGRLGHGLLRKVEMRPALVARAGGTRGGSVRTGRWRTKRRVRLSEDPNEIVIHSAGPPRAGAMRRAAPGARSPTRRSSAPRARSTQRSTGRRSSESGRNSRSRDRRPAAP